MKLIHSAVIALLAASLCATVHGQTAEHRIGVNALTLGMETSVTTATGSALQRYVDPWGAPTSVGVAEGHWEMLSGSTVSSLDYGTGKFGFRGIDAAGSASLGMDLEIATSCGGTDNAGQRGGISIKPVRGNSTGIVRSGSFHMWEVDYVVTACAAASQITLRAHPIEWVYGRKSANIPAKPQYTYNGASQTTIKLGEMREGETRLITMRTTGTVPPLPPGAPLYLNGAWYIVAVVNGDRQHKLYKDPVIAVVH